MLSVTKAIESMRREEQRHQRDKRRQANALCVLRVQECMFTKPPWVDKDALKEVITLFAASVRREAKEDEPT